MKTFLFILMVPLMVLSQSTTEQTVFENSMITVDPAKVAEFEAGMAEHNKKYHAEGVHGARVYWISNGPNTGKYIWAMGPMPWSALDNRPAAGGHDEHWNTKVLPYMMADGNTTYWRFHPELSNFPKDFTLKNLAVFMVDAKRFKDMEFMDIVKKVNKVYKAKMPDQTFGVYFNTMPSTKEGNDFAWVDFFGSMTWMGRDDKFPQYFEEVHGAGSFVKFLADVEATTEGEWSELWVLRPDLSGLPADVKAVTRQ